MATQATDERRPATDGPGALRPAEALDRARQLADEGRAIEAIEVLSAANRAKRNAKVEAELVRLRHVAFHEVEPAATPWVDHPDPFPDLQGRIPEIGRDELSAAVLGGALQHHGSLLVRGLVGEPWIGSLTEDIDEVFAGCQAHVDGAPVNETSPWFVPFKAPEGYTLGYGRQWVIDGGGVWMVDAPRAMFDVLESFEEAGLRDAVTGYLGERPALSVKKWTLRRVPIDSGTDWHQDGAFLGTGIRTVNVWLSLTRCGGSTDAPGLDVVPQRLDRIVETGTKGAVFDWSVGQGVVDEVMGGQPTERPMFAPGDALLFDEWNLHRTAAGPGMARPRYAIESWFFTPSQYPGDQCPVLW